MPRVQCFFSTLLLFLGGCNPPANQGNHVGDLKFASATKEVNGILVHYQLAGKGDPILFLHGGFGTGELHFIKQFEVLKQNNRLIPHDTRGHGQSTFDSVSCSYEL